MTGMSLAEASAHLTTTDPRFELTTADIRGTQYRVFKNTPKNLRELLQTSRPAHGEGQNEYLVYQNERWSYDAFCSEVCKMASTLKNDLDVKQGDRVALAMRNYPELPILMMAITSIGAVVVFLNAWWTSDELDYALSDSGASLVFADGPRFERIAALGPDKTPKMVGLRDAKTDAQPTKIYARRHPRRIGQTQPSTQMTIWPSCIPRAPRGTQKASCKPIVGQFRRCSPGPCLCSFRA